MACIEEYLSHPDKQLLTHVKGVLNGVKKRTNSKIAELSAIFHDIGKLNPNFQKKVICESINGYSNHAYLSAYLFLAWCSQNTEYLRTIFGDNNLPIKIVASTIAHHHGNLPNFEKILKTDELNRLENFIKIGFTAPVLDFVNDILNIKSNEFKYDFDNYYFVKSGKVNIHERDNENSLETFLETQFSFASLVAADKEDASSYTSKSNIGEFCQKYNCNLTSYLLKFKEDTDLNKLRTKIRNEAINNLNTYLKQNQRIFSLTSPTGSGKTLTLLALAGEILKTKGNYRIIYSLPFLSITEQVEEEVIKIFGENNSHISRIDSKSENWRFNSVQNQLDSEPHKIKDIINEQFAEDIFDYPFIITTFVKLFETLLSNKNSSLLRLSNFSNTIFLIDEIQTLPPRLYGFFIALLDAFCGRNNSYAIISTATMPNFELPINNRHNLKLFFKEYNKPAELLSNTYFCEKPFNRYNICIENENLTIDNLAKKIKEEDNSILVILNTISDTKELYQKFTANNTFDKVYLLNTHFTPNDRSKKINKSKTLLKKGKKILLISTQLIEAGVDIDFPIVYRDIAPIINIIQSAGRSNRNNSFINKGKIVLFRLFKNNRLRASLLYKGQDDIFLNFTMENIKENIDESCLFELQKLFFKKINQETVFATHRSNVFEPDRTGIKGIDFIKKIQEGAFNEIGKFRLIEEDFYGKEYRYFIPENKNDKKFEILEKLVENLKTIDFKNFGARKIKLIEIENHIKNMNGQIVNVRLVDNQERPILESELCCGIFKLPTEYYSFDTGVQIDNICKII